VTNVTSAAKKQKRNNLGRETHAEACLQSNGAFAFYLHKYARANESPRSCYFCGADTYYVCTGCTVPSGKREGNVLPLCSPSARKQMAVGSSSSSAKKKKMKEFDCHALYHCSKLLGHGRCDVPSSERRDWDCTREKRMDKMMSIIKKEIGNTK
jgi:hypothetical protein